MTDDPAGSALFTDLYELVMASAYLSEGVDDVATFELWIRELPPNRNFLVAAGLEQVVEHLLSLSFRDEDLAYLESLGSFAPAFLDHLRGLRFTGDVWAMPEGTIAFAPEPLLRVTARRIEAQLVETFLLASINFQTMVATKAARMVLAADGRPLADYSARRDHGPGAANLAARAAYIGGVATTSNVFAGRQFGIPVSGTMAHSMVLSFPDELTAFRAYARQNASGGTLLIDTFDTVTGARNAITVARELRDHGGYLGAVRLDSGDLGRSAFAVRALLDDAGFADVKIVASSDLDEYVIADLLADGAPIDAFGVGTRLGTSADAPYLAGVYKLVEDHSGGRAKSSAGKATVPFAKQVHRLHDGRGMVSDTIARVDEDGIPGTPLLVPVLVDGRRVRAAEPLEAIRDRCAAGIRQLPGHLRALETTDRPYPVHWSPVLEPWVSAR